MATFIEFFNFIWTKRVHIKVHHTWELIFFYSFVSFFFNWYTDDFFLKCFVKLVMIMINLTIDMNFGIGLKIQRNVSKVFRLMYVRKIWFQDRLQCAYRFWEVKHFHGYAWRQVWCTVVRKWFKSKLTRRLLLDSYVHLLLISTIYVSYKKFDCDYLFWVKSEQLWVKIGFLFEKCSTGDVACKFFVKLERFFLHTHHTNLSNVLNLQCMTIQV